LYRVTYTVMSQHVKISKFMIRPLILNLFADTGKLHLAKIMRPKKAHTWKTMPLLLYP
jgi:hypothetical protein